jgi:hypothetical protein
LAVLASYYFPSIEGCSELSPRRLPFCVSFPYFTRV